MNYSELIADWTTMNGRQKFNALARFRRKERERMKRLARKKKVPVQREEEKPEPPPGYYYASYIMDKTGISRATLKRYKKNGTVRTVGTMVNMAYCLYDVMTSIEVGARLRIENAKRTNQKRRLENR